MDSIKTQHPRRTQGKRHGRVRTPTVLQMEAVECGAAALGIILGYYGRHVSLAELRRACGVSRDGSTAANVLTAARRYGLTATGYTMEVEALETLPCPVMIFWNFDHFVVVEGFRRGRVYLNDPASGPRRVSREEFGQSFTGIVLVMAPGPDFTPSGQPPSTLHALRTRLRGAGGALAYGVLAGFFLVVPGLAVPGLTQVFVDQILIAGLHDWYAGLMLQYDVGLTGIALGCALVQVAALQWMVRRRVDATMQVLQETGKLDGLAIAGLRNMETLKAGAVESDFFARWAGYSTRTSNAQQTLHVTNQMLDALPTCCNALATMLVLVLGGCRVMEGHLSLGMLVAFQSLMQSFLAPVTTLVGFASTLQDLQGALHRLDDMLHHPSLPARVQTPGPATRTTAGWHGSVQVRNLTFGYSRVSPPTLDNISLTVQPGQRVALVRAKWCSGARIPPCCARGGVRPSAVRR